MPSLNFATHFGDKAKTPTHFKQQILNNYWSDGFKWIEKPHGEMAKEKHTTSGKKIHTIRKGERFKAQDKCHLFTGLRSKNTLKFGICECVRVQNIKIWFESVYNEKVEGISFRTDEINVHVDGRWKTNPQIKIIARNDGLTSKQFYDWFYKVTKQGTQPFEGQIIHFTNYKY